MWLHLLCIVPIIYHLVSFICLHQFTATSMRVNLILARSWALFSIASKLMPHYTCTAPEIDVPDIFMFQLFLNHHLNTQCLGRFWILIPMASQIDKNTKKDTRFEISWNPCIWATGPSAIRNFNDNLCTEVFFCFIANSCRVPKYWLPKYWLPKV